MGRIEHVSGGITHLASIVILPAPVRLCFLPIITGIFYASSFPDIDFGFLAWVSLIPLLWALRNQSPRRSFFLGWLAGTVAFTGIMYWVTISMSLYGGLPLWVTLFPLLLLAGYLGIYFGLFSFLLIWIREKVQLPDLLLVPILWTTLEWVRGHALTGLPWGLIGYTQYQNLSMIQIADITGIYGVSFLVVLINTALLQLPGAFFHVHRQKALRSIAIAILVLTLTFLYGTKRLNQFEKGANESITVGIIQANIPQDMKWDTAFRMETLSRYDNLTQSISDNKPDLIVWPEAATPFIFEDNKFFKRQVLTIAQEAGIPLLFGAPARSRKAGFSSSLTNSAYLIDSSGAILSRQDKIHLVPFGEYVPLPRILFFLDKMVEGIGNFKAGTEYTIMEVPSRNNGDAKLGTAICYEVIFPELVRRFVAEGANLMVTITNDAWFGRSSAPKQHFSMVVFRSIENRVSFIRAANTGISGFISPSGRIRKASKLFEAAAFTEPLPIYNTRSLYTRFGDLFVKVCGIIFLVLILTRIRRRKNHAGRS